MTEEIDFRLIEPARFHQLCEMYLHAKYPEFQPIDGRGGDAGIDGFIRRKERIFQFHHPISGGLRLQKLKHYLEQARMHLGVRQWTFLCSVSLTPKAWEYIESQRRVVSFDISIIAGSSLAEQILKYPHVREAFFPQETLQAVRHTLFNTVDIRTKVTRIEQRLSKTKIEKSKRGDAPDELRVTDDHKAEIYALLQKCAEEEARSKRRRLPHYQKWVGEFNSYFDLSHYHRLPDSKYLEALRYLDVRRYAGRRGEKRIDTRNRLIRQIKVTQRQLKWNDSTYRSKLEEWFDVSSSTELDIPDLQKLASKMKDLLALQSQ